MEIIVEERTRQCLQRVALQMRSQRWHLATVESCTGGWVSAAITSLPGSSEWFDMGWVVYANAAKMRYLGVDEECIATCGAVSQEVVAALMRGALALSTADVVLAVSGVAGPGGGSGEKPVGTVWMGVQCRGEAAIVQCAHFAGDRQQVRWQAVQFVLELLDTTLLHKLGGNPSVFRGKGNENGSGYSQK